MLHRIFYGFINVKKNFSECRIMNILIVKLSAIGDVIHTLPALNAVRKHYPDAHITWLVEEAASDLIVGHKALDRVLISKRKRWMKELKGPERLGTTKEIFYFIKKLRDTRYDLILDFQALLKSGILIGLTRGRRKIGFGRGLEHMEHSYIFLNERIDAVDMEIHALSRGMILLETLGIRTKKIEYKIPVSKNDGKLARDLLKQHGIGMNGPLIAINPVAKWETKLWPEKKFARLADKLIEKYHAKILFTGGLQDRPTINKIVFHMKEKPINLAGETTLKVLAALYEKTDFVISTDTGPMHLAVAMKTPVVVLFGPTAPWRTGPFGSGHQIVRAKLQCSPCFKRKCDTIKCMHQISVNQVLNAVDSVMSGV